MGFTQDAKKWADELMAAEEYRDDHLHAMKEMVQATHGPHYVRGELGRFSPENHYYAQMTLTIPRLIFDNPAVRVGTRRPGSQIETAEAIRHGINRWIHDTELRKVGIQVARDFMFNWGVMMVRQVPVPGMLPRESWIWDDEGTLQVSQEALWPSAYRVPQTRFVVDPKALTINEARWMGHFWERDAEDLIAEAKAHPDRGWDVKALEVIVQNKDSDSTAGGDTVEQFEAYQRPDFPRRKAIRGCTIYVPEMQLDGEDGPDEGYNGTILNIGHIAGSSDRKAGSRWIKEPEPYYGPPTGPYVVFGAHDLPNKLWPLSPLVAVEGQIREVNRHARAWSRSAEKHKHLVIYDEKDTKTAAKIKRAQNDFFVGIPGFDKAKFATAEVGGATDAQYKAYALLLDRLNRVSSMDEASQGNVTGIGTATEHTIADEASTTRVAFLKQQYSDSMAKVLEKVAWFMYHDDRVVFPLGEDAADDMGMEEPWFHGGTTEKDSDATFEDLELEIEAYSMERTDQASHLQKTMAAAGFLLETAPMIPLLPYVKWDEVYEMVGNAFNFPRLAELVDVEAGMAAQPFQQGSAPPQARLGKDVGTGGGGFSSGAQAPAQGITGGQGGLSPTPKGFGSGAQSAGAGNAVASFGGK